MTNNRRYHEQMIHRSIALLETHYCTTCPMPKILWDLKGKGRLGEAYGTHKIRLNHQYEAALPATEFVRVAIHEACHTFVNSQKPRGASSAKGEWRHHGSRWQSAMRVLGQDPTRLFDPTVYVPSARKSRPTSIFG